VEPLQPIPQILTLTFDEIVMADNQAKPKVEDPECPEDDDVKECDCKCDCESKCKVYHIVLNFN
jgi:hypothetical protein